MVTSLRDRGKFDHFLRRIPLFSPLSEEAFQEVKKATTEKSFTRNQVILYEEDTPHYLYFVYFGKVKVVQINEEGAEQIVAVHKRGDFFGEMAILDGKTIPARVVALEETRVGFFSKKDFERYLLKNEKVMMEIISMLCARLREAWFMLKVMGFSDAEHRVRAVLNHIGDQFGIQDQRGTIINARLTHSDIANYASLSRETASRTMKHLERRGDIEILENRRILLKPIFKKVDLL